MIAFNSPLCLICAIPPDITVGHETSSSITSQGTSLLVRHNKPIRLGQPCHQVACQTLLCATVMATGFVQRVPVLLLFSFFFAPVVIFHPDPLSRIKWFD